MDALEELLELGVGTKPCKPITLNMDDESIIYNTRVRKHLERVYYSYALGEDKFNILFFYRNDVLMVYNGFLKYHYGVNIVGGSYRETYFKNIKYITDVLDQRVMLYKIDSQNVNDFIVYYAVITLFSEFTKSELSYVVHPKKKWYHLLFPDNNKIHAEALNKWNKYFLECLDNIPVESELLENIKKIFSEELDTNDGYNSLIKIQNNFHKITDLLDIPKVLDFRFFRRNYYNREPYVYYFNYSTKYFKFKLIGDE